MLGRGFQFAGWYEVTSGGGVHPKLFRDGVWLDIYLIELRMYFVHMQSQRTGIIVVSVHLFKVDGWMDGWMPPTTQYVTSLILIEGYSVTR